MSTRRCVFQHGEVGIIGTRQRILTQSPYTEIRQTETFALRNIHRSIKVYQISRRAMSLISGFSPVPMRPLRPLTGEILLQQFTESFTIIGDDTPGLVRTLPCRQKLRQVFFQFITATRQKLIKKSFRPVRPVNLIGVVKEIMGISCSTTCRILELSVKSAFKASEIVFHGTGREMIHHIPLTAGCRTLHLLQSLAAKGGNQTPAPFRSFPA